MGKTIDFPKSKQELSAIDLAAKRATMVKKKLDYAVLMMNNQISPADLWQALVDIEILSEKLTGELRVLLNRLSPPYASPSVDDIVATCMDIDIKITSDSVFAVRMPCLLPKKEKGNASYIRAGLFCALKKYFRQNHSFKISVPSTIIFVHHFTGDSGRDHDNIELNTVVDLISLFVLEDDSPYYLDHYYTSRKSDKDLTEIYVVPNHLFSSFIGRGDGYWDKI